MIKKNERGKNTLKEFMRNGVKRKRGQGLKER
jgi:hypothetical protein